MQTLNEHDDNGGELDNETVECVTAVVTAPPNIRKKKIWEKDANKMINKETDGTIDVEREDGELSCSGEEDDNNYGDSDNDGDYDKNDSDDDNGSSHGQYYKELQKYHSNKCSKTLEGDITNKTNFKFFNDIQIQ